MTTIAYDGKMLCGDGRITRCTDIESDTFCKIIKLYGVSYMGDTLSHIGVAGDISHLDEFLALLQDTEFHVYREDSDREISALALGLHNVYVIKGYDMSVVSLPLDTKIAIGSGAPYAKSAMKLGMCAKRAIKHAMTLDCATGGKIVTARYKV